MPPRDVTSIGSSDRRPCVGRSADARGSTYCVWFTTWRTHSCVPRRDFLDAPWAGLPFTRIKTFFTAFVSASFPVHGLYSPVRGLIISLEIAVRYSQGQNVFNIKFEQSFQTRCKPPFITFHHYFNCEPVACSGPGPLWHFEKPKPIPFPDTLQNRALPGDKCALNQNRLTAQPD